MVDRFARKDLRIRSLPARRRFARLILILGVIPAVLLVQCAGSESKEGEKGMTIELTSPAFEAGGVIPTKHTCDGADVSPRLEWSGAPEGTKTLALICDDPDAPMGTWVHWVIYDIPADTTSLSEGVPRDETVEDIAVQGTNDFKRIGYGGPCPPRGKPHRYFFKLYALDSRLELKPGAKKKDVEEAMEGHVLAKGELVGKYQR
jgi:Raf kinase inhibitor-like YbhB/YbcL family protein